jgi:hypothetical protein
MRSKQKVRLDRHDIFVIIVDFLVAGAGFIQIPTLQKTV